MTSNYHLQVTKTRKTPPKWGKNSRIFPEPSNCSGVIDGKEYWRTGEPVLPAASDPQSIYLLPGFDEYLLGYTDRSAVLGGEHAQKIVPGSNGVFRPMLVIGGQVVGGWQRSLKKNSVKITISPFIPLTVPEERLFAAAQRYTDFLGLPLSSLVIEESK